MVRSRTLNMPPMASVEQPAFLSIVPNGFPEPQLPGEHGQWLEEYWAEFARLLDACLGAERRQQRHRGANGAGRELRHGDDGCRSSLPVGGFVLDERGVTFQFKDYRAKGRCRYGRMTLPVDEFMRRFLLHVLPRGFHRIRHYGLLANAARVENLARARELLHQGYSCTVEDLARQGRNAFYGAEALHMQRGKDEVKVMIRYPESERRSLGYVEDMRIRTPAGAEVPFNQVAQVDIQQGYATIERAQRYRVVKVTADVEEKVTNANEVRNLLTADFLPDLKARYPGLRYTIEGVGKQQKDTWADVLNGFGIALFGIYALLAVPFRSFSQPIIVMSAIPFGFVGALAGHLIMGFNISLLSLFGMVGLAGIVVNDSLVLFYFVNVLC